MKNICERGENYGLGMCQRQGNICEKRKKNEIGMCQRQENTCKKGKNRDKMKSTK